MCIISKKNPLRLKLFVAENHASLKYFTSWMCVIYSVKNIPYCYQKWALALTQHTQCRYHYFGPILVPRATWNMERLAQVEPSTYMLPKHTLLGFHDFDCIPYHTGHSRFLIFSDYIDWFLILKMDFYGFLSIFKIRNRSIYPKEIRPNP